MDPSSRPIYAQVLEFQIDITRHELIFDDPNSSTQAYIQTLARGLGLEFEYSTITNCARVTHHLSDQPQPAQSALEEDFLHSLDLEQSSAAQLGAELRDSDEVPRPAPAD